MTTTLLNALVQTCIIAFYKNMYVKYY